MRGARPQWAVIKTTQIGPRCAISELKERRKAARPSPTNAATQDAAPAVRVARRACFLCANARRRPKKPRRDFPPPKKAAPWANTHNAAGSREPGVLVPPSQHAGPSVSKQHKRQREAARSRSHSAHEEGKERARRRSSASAGGRRRKAPCSWVPLRDAAARHMRPSSSAECRMHVAERRSTKHAPGFATREADRGRQVMRLEHDR